jgi:hypothetical protein
MKSLFTYQKHLTLWTSKNGLLTLFLISIGLTRFLFLNSWGIVDSEWWRAWMNHISQVGFSNLYSDAMGGFQVYQNLKHPQFLDSHLITFPHIEVPVFNPNEYFRSVFPIAQPPIFFLDLALALKVKNIFSLESDYMALNLTNILLSIVLTAVMVKILKNMAVPNHTNWALALIWANPMVILQANLQGYRDLLMLVLITISLALIQKNEVQPFIAGIIFGLACMTKPTALYVFLAIFLILSNKHFFQFNLGVATVVLIVASLYLITSRLYGLFAAILTEMSFAKNFSEGVSPWSIFKLFEDYSEFIPINLSAQTYISSIASSLSNYLGLISIIHLVGFLIIACRLRKNKNLTVFDPQLQLFTISLYFLTPNSRMNHYFVFLTIWLIGLANSKTRSISIIVIFIYFLQDFVYGGFGRSSIYEGAKISLVVNIILSISYLFFFLNKYLNLSKFDYNNKIIKTKNK